MQPRSPSQRGTRRVIAPPLTLPLLLLFLFFLIQSSGIPFVSATFSEVDISTNIGLLGPSVVGLQDLEESSRMPSVQWGRATGTTRAARGSACQGPCLCIVENDLLIMDCSMVESHSNLTQAFEGITWASIVPLGVNISKAQLVLQSSEITRLPPDAFGGVAFHSVHAKYNHALGPLEEGVLRASYNTLRVLDLRNNNMTSFALSDLRSFEGLEFMSLDDNKVLLLPAWVSGLPRLVHLSLANNIIAALHPEALKGMPALQFLDLHSNRLASVPKAIGDLPNLRSLLLWGNPITTLEPGCVGGLQSLEYLDLSHTLISTLKEEHLWTNTTSPWFLSLHQSPISTIHPRAFHPDHLPFWLDLGDSQVTTLEQEVFLPLVKHMAKQYVVHTDWGKPQIWLTNDVLTCDCSAKWIITNVTLLRHVTATCTHKNIHLRLLDSDFFNIFCY
ncbi:uncharacterized protein LOC143021784 [Oratosquilla oratoria]|uniref:uncharacterized protein LOC143021784 n=1 Tax=Oratosquilla oratoria TaxID=337810 RepID=UPI003F770438